MLFFNGVAVCAAALAMREDCVLQRRHSVSSCRYRAAGSTYVTFDRTCRVACRLSPEGLSTEGVEASTLCNACREDGSTNATKLC